MMGSFARGFFVGNSEVGKSSLFAGFFLFDYVCCNRIIFGADQYTEVRIRHTKGAPDRWLEEIVPVLQDYSEGSAKPVVQAIEDAQQAHRDRSRPVPRQPLHPGEGRVGEHAIGDQTVTRGTIAAGQIVLDDVEIVERPWVKYGQPADSPIAPLLPASDAAIASRDKLMTPGVGGLRTVTK
jgi:hypothetical protein